MLLFLQSVLQLKHLVWLFCWNDWFWHKGFIKVVFDDLVPHKYHEIRLEICLIALPKLFNQLFDIASSIKIQICFKLIKYWMRIWKSEKLSDVNSNAFIKVDFHIIFEMKIYQMKRNLKFLQSFDFWIRLSLGLLNYNLQVFLNWWVN